MRQFQYQLSLLLNQLHLQCEMQLKKSPLLKSYQHQHLILLNPEQYNDLSNFSYGISTDCRITSCRTHSKCNIKSNWSSTQYSSDGDDKSSNHCKYSRHSKKVKRAPPRNTLSTWTCDAQWCRICLIYLLWTCHSSRLDRIRNWGIYPWWSHRLTRISCYDIEWKWTNFYNHQYKLFALVRR